MPQRLRGALVGDTLPVEHSLVISHTDAGTAGSKIVVPATACVRRNLSLTPAPTLLNDAAVRQLMPPLRARQAPRIAELAHWRRCSRAGSNGRPQPGADHGRAEVLLAPQVTGRRWASARRSLGRWPGSQQPHPIARSKTSQLRRRALTKDVQQGQDRKHSHQAQQRLARLSEAHCGLRPIVTTMSSCLAGQLSIGGDAVKVVGYVPAMENGTRPQDRVEQRHLAPALARRFRGAEGLSIAEIARRPIASPQSAISKHRARFRSEHHATTPPVSVRGTEGREFEPLRARFTSSAMCVETFPRARMRLDHR